MAVQGIVATYDLTVGVKLDIEDLITLISPTDVPLLGGQGADGGSALASGPIFEKKYEWLDEDLLLPRSTSGALVSSTTTTTLTVATGHQIRFSTGDSLLLASGEQVRVTDYGTTTDTLIVTRAFNSSTAANITTGDSITIIGNILAEGSDPSKARSQDRNNRFNYTQIFGPTAVQVSGSENAVQKYGLSVTEFDKQVANRTREQFIEIEQAILYGQRIEDTSNRWRAFGGLNYWISTNVDSTTTVITETLLLNQIQSCYDAGGSPDRLVVGSKQKRTISGFAVGITVQTFRPDTERGTVVDFFDSDFGRVSTLLNRWVNKPHAFLFSRDQAEVVTLRPMQFEMLSKTGDSEKGQVVCEKGFKLRAQQHAAVFNALT